MLTRCYFCGGKIESRRVTAENWWGEQLALVEKVPASVCMNCGEAYFDAETCKQLDHLRSAPPPALKTVEIPVYPFSAQKGKAMSRNYHVVPRDDGWAVLREGADRAGSVHDTQSEAIDVGRERAIRDRGELIIHDQHGRIRDKDSYGHDPYPPKDTKH